MSTSLTSQSGVGYHGPCHNPQYYTPILKYFLCTFTEVSQLPANDSSIHLIKSLITDGSPLIAETDFYPPTAHHQTIPQPQGTMLTHVTSPCHVHRDVVTYNLGAGSLLLTHRHR